MSGPAWRRLDARMLAVRPARELARLAPLLLVVLVVGSTDRTRVLIAAGVAVAILLAGVVQWLTTRYRITEEHVELRTGWLFRKRRAVPRDRLRTVDLTSDVLHRLFRLSVVKVGAGNQAGSEDELSLDAVSGSEADRLRTELLAGAPSRPAAAAGDAPAEPPTRELARLDPRWLRYAPLTVTGLAVLGAAFGGTSQLLRELRIDPAALGPLQAGAQALRELPLAGLIAGAAVALLLLSAVAACVTYAVRYWNFCLTREPDGTLRVRRGLLTTRSVSIDEVRLQGVSLGEPLLLRAAGGAHSASIASGLGAESENVLLLPPAPLTQARRIAGLALDAEPNPLGAALTGHPAAALRRRFLRALSPVLVGTAVLFGLARAELLPEWPWLVALPGFPLGAALALDRYRGLGHAHDGAHLISRTGSLVRTTTALRTGGIIGWRIRRSFFQRRSGLATLTATTAAGAGAYSIPDVSYAEGLELAVDAVPGLLEPFTERDT